MATRYRVRVQREVKERGRMVGMGEDGTQYIGEGRTRKKKSSGLNRGSWEKAHTLRGGKPAHRDWEAWFSL